MIARIAPLFAIFWWSSSFSPALIDSHPAVGNTSTKYFILHCRYEAPTEGNSKKVINIFYFVWILSKCPFDIDHKFSPIYLPTFVHVNSFEPLPGIGTRKASKVRSHKTVVKGIKLKCIVSIIFLKKTGTSKNTFLQKCMHPNRNDFSPTIRMPTLF